MSREENAVRIYDDGTDEYLGVISPMGGRVEDIEKICEGYKPGSIRIMQVAWPGYHSVNIFVKGEKIQ